MGFRKLESALSLYLINMTTGESSLLDVFGQLRKPTWSCDLEPHLYTSLKTLWLGSHYNAHKDAFTVDAAEFVIFMADNAPDESRNAQTLLVQIYQKEP